MISYSYQYLPFICVYCSRMNAINAFFFNDGQRRSDMQAQAAAATAAAAADTPPLSVATTEIAHVIQPDPHKNVWIDHVPTHIFTRLILEFSSTGPNAAQYEAMCCQITKRLGRAANCPSTAFTIKQIQAGRMLLKIRILVKFSKVSFLFTLFVRTCPF